MVFNRKENNKKWRENNKEHIKEWGKQYRENNKEKEKERQKKYYQSPVGNKKTTFKRWKQYGLIEHGYTYDEVYEYYLETTHCEVCNKDLSTTQKCMDHCHTDGCFRWVLCKSCNTNDYWMKKI